MLKSPNIAVKNLFTICSKLKLLYKRKTHAPQYYTTDSVLTQTLFSGNRSHKLNNNFDITATTIKYILSTNRFDGVYIHIYIIHTIYNIYTYIHTYIYMYIYIYIYDIYVMEVSQKSVFPTSFSRGSFQENLF